MADSIRTLLSDKGLSAQEAAQKLAHPCRAAFINDGDRTRFEDELYELWTGILAAVEKIPHDQQDKAVDVMRAIKHMPQPVHGGKKPKIWGAERPWDELPTFGAMAREQLDIARGKPDEAFVNLNAFFARLTAADVEDFSLFALWALREALEDPPGSEIVQKTSPELLKTAAVWLVYAAESLAKVTKKGEQYEDRVGAPGDSLSGFEGRPGWRGFCQDRWKIWGARLASVKGAEKLVDARPLVEQALDEFNKV